MINYYKQLKKLDYPKEDNIKKLQMFLKVQVLITIKTQMKHIHFAITGHTAAELIYSRVNSEKIHRGLTNWKKSPNGKIMKYDISIAKIIQKNKNQKS